MRLPGTEVKHMSLRMKRLLHWSPRVLSIALAVSLSLFALDVFNEPQGFWLTGVALMIHLAPALLVVAMLIAAWRWEWAGALLFALAAALYTRDVLPTHPSWAAIVSGPLLLIAGLFLADWLVRMRVRVRP